jgi:DNA-binding transcriptional ArsR family regulator
MTPRMLDWVRLPTGWIQEHGLDAFRWGAGVGSDNVAALMTLVAIAHHADQQSGTAIITYDNLTLATGLSRSKVSAGLSVLSNHALIDRAPSGRSSFTLRNFDPTRGWSKLPARQLYSAGAISAFGEFKLRNSAELNAMKLFLLFVARRGNDTNLANISYDKITEYSGLDRSRIKQGLSVLAVAGLVHIERTASDISEFGVANAYRIPHLDPYAHMGTRGRTLEGTDGWRTQTAGGEDPPF